MKNSADAEIKAEVVENHGLNYSIEITLPPLGVTYYKLEKELPVPVKKKSTSKMKAKKEAAAKKAKEEKSATKKSEDKKAKEKKAEEKPKTEAAEKTDTTAEAKAE